jgi:putative flippase GtrA
MHIAHRQVPALITNYLQSNSGEIARFVLVGFETFLLKLVLLYVLYGIFGYPYKIAVTAAFFAAVINHYFLSRYFTYAAGKSAVKLSAARYLVQLSSNYLLTLMVVTACVEWGHLSPYWGVVISTAMGATISYLLMKYFVFKSEKIE